MVFGWKEEFPDRQETRLKGLCSEGVVQPDGLNLQPLIQTCTNKFQSRSIPQMQRKDSDKNQRKEKSLASQPGFGVLGY
jgi:hypothetical protein